VGLRRWGEKGKGIPKEKRGKKKLFLEPKSQGRPKKGEGKVKSYAKEETSYESVTALMERERGGRIGRKGEGKPDLIRGSARRKK